MRRSFLVVLLILVGCEDGGKPLPQKPQLILDRDSVGFGQEFGSGTFIGTQPQQTLLIENGGLDTLVLQAPTLEGDPAFTLEGPPDLQVVGKGHTFLGLTFAPQQAKAYSATVTILSNAENAPTKTVAVSGVGVLPRDGG